MSPPWDSIGAQGGEYNLLQSDPDLVLIAKVFIFGFIGDDLTHSACTCGHEEYSNSRVIAELVSDIFSTRSVQRLTESYVGHSM